MNWGSSRPRTGAPRRANAAAARCWWTARPGWPARPVLSARAGTEITTVEGFDEAELDAMASTFAAYGALQCGFCTPGIVVRLKALLDRKGSALTREEASRHLGGHLCAAPATRRSLDAVESLAAGGGAGGAAAEGRRQFGRALRGPRTHAGAAVRTSTTS